MTIKSMLHDYAQVSGQAINFAKSSIYFNPNMDDYVRQDVYSLLQVEESDNLGTYLGLPTSIGRNKKEVFSFVKGKVWKHLSS